VDLLLSLARLTLTGSSDCLLGSLMHRAFSVWDTLNFLFFLGPPGFGPQGRGEDVFSGPFSSSTCTGVPRDASGISSSSYIFINSLKGFDALVSTDTRTFSG
jgi:hypothetical protein